MNSLTLSITTIGDLLLNKTITNGKDPIKDIELRVPLYQRPYKWTARNAIQLLDDIIEAKNSNKEKYRVGTLILHKAKENNQAEGCKQYDIVDGQQRTITFALLLTALGEKGIDFLKQEVYDNAYNKHNIVNNYNALFRRVGLKAGTSNSAEEHQREMSQLKDYIKDKCELIVVITTDLSEAFQFFDSQNARGKELYPHDLLKAYHLREMYDVSEEETERIVKDWEQISQRSLANLFGNYLYRIKEWVAGNKAKTLNKHNIQMFKGITRSARTPYAQFYKSAYCYADIINTSAMPFVSGIQNVNAFQLDTPIIAGKPFFKYTKHYYNILKDIQNNNKSEGFYINDNIIVKTLDRHFKKGVGNGIARLMFDTSVLLYVDRFCPETHPTKGDIELFEQFVTYAFIWAYSLRAQFANLGWRSAQNYIMGWSNKINTFNMYKQIAKQDTPTSLLNALADKLNQLSKNDIKDGRANKCYECNENYKTLKELKKDDVYENYLYFFQINGFYKNDNNERIEQHP